MISRGRLCVDSLAAVLVMLLLQSTGLAQFEARSVEEFSRATLMQKRQALGRIASHNAVATSVEAEHVLRAALADPAPEVREAGLFALAGRLRSAGRSAELVEVWRREAPSLRTARAVAVKLLADADPKVRVAAMNALCAIDFDPTKAVEEANTLAQPTAAVLVHVYSTDGSPVVRAHSISLLGLTPIAKSAAGLVDAALVKALADSQSGVVQSAATGIGRRKIAMALPDLARLLSDKRPEVRMRSAQAIGQFGAAAKPLLPELEAALSRETEDIVRKTLDAVIQRFGR